MDWLLERVVSGGQSGADRAGLEVAKVLGIPTGGVAPKGFRTEYGADLDLRDVFGLTESLSPDYTVRTLANVMDSDATVVFGDVTSTGTRGTLQNCRMWEKIHWENPTAEQLRRYIYLDKIKTLNVAGNRHSRSPKLFDHVVQILAVALRAPDGPYLLRSDYPANPHAMYTLPSPGGAR